MSQNNHDIFQLIWKSSYAVDKHTIEVVLKELNDEIRFQSTILLPRATSAVNKKNVMKTLASLRSQRDSLLMKYDDKRMPRASGGLGGDPQSTDENYKKSEDYEVTQMSDGYWAVVQGDRLIEDRFNSKTAAEKYIKEKLQKSFKKSISKIDILKALYGRAWGSMAGLNEDALHKMNNSELDEQIKALEVLFD